MNPWRLTRDDIQPKGTWGTLTSPDGSFIVQTLENTAKRIKPGVYLCKRDYYHRGGYETFEILYPDGPDPDNKPDRTRLLFHAANYAHQLEGCVAPGMERGYTEDHVPAVWRSRVAHTSCMEQWEGLQHFPLYIYELSSQGADYDGE